MDSKVLSPNHVNQLLKFLPTAEEIGMLSAYKDEMPENLAQADRFLVELLRIDRFEYLLRVFDFKNMYDEHVRDVRDGVEAIRQGTETIRKSNSIKSLFELILMIGNVLNNSSFRGGAFGFRVNSLNSVRLFDTFNYYYSHVLFIVGRH